MAAGNPALVNAVSEINLISDFNIQEVPPMTLQEQLAAIKAKSAAAMTPEVVDAMKQSFNELRESKLLDQVLRVGDTAPAFTLPNGEGRLIHSGDLLHQGPLVVLFYRGKW